MIAPIRFFESRIQILRTFPVDVIELPGVEVQ